MRSNKRKWIVRISIFVCAVVIVGLIVRLVDPNPYRSRTRKAWVTDAIQSIQTQSDERGVLEERWVGKEMLVMKNDEWIKCRSACAKDEQPRIQKDIFIGLGSDGKWYFTTYHFCVGKMVLKYDQQPASIEEFVQTYSVRKFDGNAANCLDPTWP